MFSEMARVDLERLRANGFKPTDAEVIRLNDLGVRIERGKNTTVANMPRIGCAGNVILYEPTVGMLEWWHNFGRDASWTTRGKLDTYYFALAHSRDAELLDGLTKAGEIRRAVRVWKTKVFATDGEMWRALMWVKSGVNGDDAETEKAAMSDSVKDDAVMDKLYASVIAAAGALGVTPDKLRTSTPTELSSLLVQANLHARIPMKTSVAKDYIAYQMTVRKIEARGTGNG